jgi:hypothetical protein
MTARTALAGSYDLTYRPQPGTSSFHCLDIIYRQIGEGGVVKGVENWRGAFRREIDSVDTDRGVTETITWKHVGRRERTAEPPYGEWQAIDWAHDFSYQFRAESDYSDFHWGYESFPRDESTWPLGWNVLLLTVDAHFEFDFLRSKRHGAIDQLTKVGDSLLTPDSDRPFWLGLPPVVDVPAFTKRNLRSTFIGLGRANNVDCGVIAFGMDVSPFEMTIAGATVSISSIFRGTLHVNLEDGVLEHGEFDEFVVGARDSVFPRYEIQRIDRATWEHGPQDLAVP